MIRIFIALILVFGSGCKTTSKANQETARFEIQKTACFGTCPEYTFTLDLSGNATYSGLKNVTKIGAYKKKFSVEEIRKVIDAFEAANFWAFKDKYVEPGVSDMPSVYVTFEHNGKTKKTENQFNAPKELKSLEKMLEELANTEGWTKTGDIQKP